jgi:DNA-binding CsgD family transcriptional regulator
MKCPKCTQGLMWPETDLEGRETGRVCRVCGHRTWADFTVRHATKRDADTCHTAAHVLRPKRMLTDAERQYIIDKRAAGMPGKEIAANLGISQNLVFGALSRHKVKQKEVNHA